MTQVIMHVMTSLIRYVKHTSSPANPTWNRPSTIEYKRKEWWSLFIRTGNKRIQAPTSCPSRPLPTMMILCFLLSTLLLLQPSDALYADTCRHDRQCISRHGVGSCCAPRRPIFSPLPVCKSAGQVGDTCQRSGERLAYPTSVGRRQYIFTCPCAEGLQCELFSGYADIGTCVPVQY
ncbi:uncharacterized protein LOC118410446 [Branchiostoma floridae]|uniref:Uncharacterized protein LOC118410446 n=1 Tax=Branchiostoma floridae TaxID=7739 RepID=A0A9J7KQ11_BRAFL|nr:uncharacterized protein LOC118410446 [Branchiostoma floridae]